MGLRPSLRGGSTPRPEVIPFIDNGATTRRGLIVRPSGRRPVGRRPRRGASTRPTGPGGGATAGAASGERRRSRGGVGHLAPFTTRRGSKVKAPRASAHVDSKRAKACCSLFYFSVIGAASIIGPG